MAKPKRISSRNNKKKTESSWPYLVAPIIILIAGLGFIGYYTQYSDTLVAKENKEANLWAVNHWQTPIPLQGEAPENYQLLTKGLQATDCRNCHIDKYEEWSQSLHAEAMGPGVVGQYPHFGGAEKASCNRCHAPMTEQWEEIQNDSKQWVKNAAFQKPLHDEALTCAACHLRNHQRIGPPLRPGKESLSQALHGEPLRTDFFESSEFCKRCHQHSETESAKIGGKVVQNTFIEWLESPAYDEGKSCQSCHMPDRKHLWKGIHDKGMTASGVTITHSMSTKTPKVGDDFEATLTLTNTGTGHYFPTYTTPAVFLKASFLDESGSAVPNYYAEQIIQRRLNMSRQPWTETFDTRVAPNDSITLNFEKEIPPQAKSFMLWVWVEPDHFYEGFYRSTLRNSPNHKGRSQLEEALQTTLDRQYSLFSVTIPITQN